MRSCRISIAAVLLAAVPAPAACAKESPPAEVPPPSVAEPAPAPESAAAPTAAPPASPADASAPEPAPAEPAVPAPSKAELAAAVRDACQAWCQRLSDKCSVQAGRSCKANCTRYQTVDPRCFAAAKLALECAASAPDLICAGVPPESCVVKFKALSTCEENPEATEKEQTSRLPEGWQVVRDASAGFSVAMPPGAARTTRNGHPGWSASTPDGVVYYALVQPGPGEKASDKWLLRTAIEFVTPACQKELRLTGKFDKDGATAVRLDTTCPDGKHWHGILWAKPDRLHITALHAPPGKNGVFEAFAYSFDYL